MAQKSLPYKQKTFKKHTQTSRNLIIYISVLVMPHGSWQAVPGCWGAGE